MKQTVYDAQGNSYTLDSVDAREYLATGRYFTDVPTQEAEKSKRVSDAYLDSNDTILSDLPFENAGSDSLIYKRDDISLSASAKPKRASKATKQEAEKAE